MKKICVIFLVALLFISTVSCASAPKAPGTDDPVNTAPPKETEKEEEPTTVVETEATTTEEETDPLLLELPEFPVVVEYGNQGQIAIVDLSYDYEYFAPSGTCDIQIEFKAEILRATSGQYGFKIKLLEDGIVVWGGDYWFTGSFDEGDIIKKSFSLNNISAGLYELNFTDH